MKNPELVQPGLHGAFIKDGFSRGPNVVPTSTLLQGLTLAVKDVFDIEGLQTSAGNPAWWAEQQPATATAYAVETLLTAGATWVGKTVTDELAYSLTGSNIHYGTPINPVDPRRLPGGSSSGSAVAVAAGHADIGLATDCGGSARLPASYCGVWGMRPSHGYAGKSGFPLAPSFDTVGWFTRSGKLVTDVLNVLAPGLTSHEPSLWIVPQDALSVCEPAVQHAISDLLHDLACPLKELPSGSLPLDEWANAYRVLAGAEIWHEHGRWVQENSEHLARDVRSRFVAASRVTEVEVAAGQVVRRNATAFLEKMLANHAVILMPTVPGPAPLVTTSEDVLAIDRQRVQQLVSAAGLAGLPQVSFPWVEIDGAPVGLSVMGAKGNDATVVRAAMHIARHIRGNK